MAYDRSKYKEMRERKRMRSILDSWYGRRDGAVELAAYFSQLTPIGECIGRFLEKSLPESDSHSLALQERWCEILGEQLTKVARFRSFIDGELTVEVTHSAWRREMDNERVKQQLSGKIDAIFGTKNLCKKIFFVPGGSWKKKTTS